MLCIERAIERLQRLAHRLAMYQRGGVGKGCRDIEDLRSETICAQHLGVRHVKLLSIVDQRDKRLGPLIKVR